MPRWESDAQGRLERAALELFETQGFEQTAVAEIARAAGLKERSFYRYFSDKREVFFADDELEMHLMTKVQAAAPDVAPIKVLLDALGSADEVLQPREVMKRRLAVISSSPALTERDLIKLASIADALAQAMERRGVEPGRARFIIDVAIAVSRRATSRWLRAADKSLSELMVLTTAELCETVLPADARDDATRATTA